MSAGAGASGPPAKEPDETPDVHLLEVPGATLELQFAPGLSSTAGSPSSCATNTPCS